MNSNRVGMRAHRFPNVGAGFSGLDAGEYYYHEPVHAHCLQLEPDLHKTIFLLLAPGA